MAAIIYPCHVLSSISVSSRLADYETLVIYFIRSESDARGDNLGNSIYLAGYSSVCQFFGHQLYSIFLPV